MSTGKPNELRETELRLARHPIAITGMAGIFPRARDLREYWTNILDATDCTSEVPPTAFSLDDHWDPDPFAEDRTYCRRGAFLPPVELDPMEFGLTPNTITATGLIQLASLVAARDALADAGARHGRRHAPWFDPRRAGVILGVAGVSATMIPLAARLEVPRIRDAARSCGLAEADTEELVRRYLAAFPSWSEDSFPGVLGNVVAGRIANRFDLGATNCTVDAACASSLAALRMAVSELVEGRADLMLTGGCDTDNTIAGYLCFSKTPALSFSGQVRPFDAKADGTLVGEGIGMLVLKRLADAERDGDRVYAVLRGLGSASDGTGKAIYAPCGDGQLLALRRAYQDAEVDPGSVGLIEAHGTGTTVGDEVELSALNTLFAGDGQQPGTGPGTVAVGSVKSQIGHTKAAAGAAGMIKAALALHQGVLPPTINVDTPLAEAGRPGSAVYVNTRTRPWLHTADQPVLRAGVSSFGFGGINLHAVLEEYPQSPRPLLTWPRTLLWHAPDPAGLAELLAAEAEPAPGPVPADHARIGLVAADADEARELRELALQRLRAEPEAGDWEHPRGVCYRRRAAWSPGQRVAALFAGQGSQYVDMGLGAALALPPVRAAFDLANRLSAPEDPLDRVVFPVPGPTGRDPGAEAERLRRTEYAQPAIGALSLGQYTVLRAAGFAPDGLLGHSFGELTALWAAGCLTDTDLLRLASARGRAMATEPAPGHDPGAMAAVRAPAEAVEGVQRLLSDFPSLRICNRNAPDELVVGGASDALEAFLARCAQQSLPARRLPVAAAFHTPHVAHAVEPFRAAVAGTELAPPRIPVLANTVGAEYGSDPRANRETLVRQLLEPVDFAGRIQQLYEAGFRVFVEFGPKDVLGQLVRRTLPDRPLCVVSADAGPGTDSALALRRAVLRLTVYGLPLTVDAGEPEAAPTRQPSRLTRALHGPNFAVQDQAERFQATLAEPYQVTGVAPAETAMPVAPPPGLAVEQAELARAAADHLDLHNQYLRSQLRAGERLTELAADPDATERAGALSRHSQALSRSHIQANEVLAALLGSGISPVSPVSPVSPDSDLDPDRTVELPILPAPQPGAPAAETQPRVPAQRAPDPAGSTAAPSAPRRSAVAELYHQSGGDLGSLLADDTAESMRAVGDAFELDRDQVEQALREIVAEKTGYTADLIDPDLDIQADLGIDSLKQVEIAAELWRRFPVIPRESIYQLAGARTVRELTERVERMAEAIGGVQRYRQVAGVELGRVVPGLRRLPEPDRLVDGYGPDPVALLVDDGSELAAALAERLRGRGWRVETAETAETAEPDPGRLPAEVRLCLLVATENDSDPVTVLKRSALLTGGLLRTLRASAADGHRVGLVTVTRLDGALGHRTDQPRQALLGGLSGLVRAVSLEVAELYTRAVDLAPDLPAAEAADRVLAEVEDAAATVREVGLDRQGRWALEVTESPARPLSVLVGLSPPVPTAELAATDVLLVTGGAKGITGWCVRALAERYRCSFLLLGRTPLERDSGEIGQILTELRGLGLQAEYLAADLADAAAVRTVLAPHADQVTGLLHGAGVLVDGVLEDRTEAELDQVLGPKLTGLLNVLDMLDEQRLRHLYLFSSISGVYGNARQAPYATANAALNRFATAWRAAHPDCRTVALAWGPWTGGMATEAVQELFRQHGVPMFSRQAGCEYLLTELATAAEPVVVLGPTRPVYERVEPLPKDGLELERRLEPLADDPVQADHVLTAERVPVMPLTGVLGWGIHQVETAQNQGRVVEVLDFRLPRGVRFDAPLSPGYRTRLTPAEDGLVAVAARDAAGSPVFETRLRLGDRPPEPPAPVEPGPDLAGLDWSDHPIYTEGILHHGPTLRGLGPELDSGPGQVLVAAALPDADYGHGGFQGRWYSAVTADLVLQGAALLVWRTTGEGCLPVGVDRVELFDRLPDGERFLIRLEVDSTTPLDVRCTGTAFTGDGRVLQRWSGIRMLVTPEELARQSGWLKRLTEEGA